MFKVKVVLGAALLTAPALWTVVSIASEPVTEQTSVRAPHQANALRLMPVPVRAGY